MILKQIATLKTFWTCVRIRVLGINFTFSQVLNKIFLSTAPPSFIKSPRDLTVLDGETVTMDCRVKGFPVPAIAWYKDRARLPSDGRHIVLPSGTLRILHVNKANEGTYQCQAINVIGVNSTFARLRVSNRGKTSFFLRYDIGKI